MKTGAIIAGLGIAAVAAYLYLHSSEIGGGGSSVSLGTADATQAVGMESGTVPNIIYALPQESAPQLPIINLAGAGDLLRIASPQSPQPQVYSTSSSSGGTATKKATLTEAAGITAGATINYPAVPAGMQVIGTTATGAAIYASPYTHSMTPIQAGTTLADMQRTAQLLSQFAGTAGGGGTNAVQVQTQTQSKKETTVTQPLTVEVYQRMGYSDSAARFLAEGGLKGGSEVASRTMDTKKETITTVYKSGAYEVRDVYTGGIIAAGSAGSYGMTKKKTTTDTKYSTATGMPLSKYRAPY